MNTFGLNIKLPPKAVSEAATPEAAVTVQVVPAAAVTTPKLYFDPTYLNLPDSMTSEKHFLGFQCTWDAATRKFDKKPFNPVTGAWENKPENGVSFADALSGTLKKPNSVLGLYIKSPYIGIDCDGCRDPLTGIISEKAMGVIREMDSYAEVSPSGTGIRIIITGQKPGDGCRRGSIEIYSVKRGVTLTGMQIDGTPSTVNSRDVSGLYNRMLNGEFVTGKESGSRASSSSPSSSTGVRLEQDNTSHITTKLQVLMTGDVEGDLPLRVTDGHWTYIYDSASEAVYSLLCCLAMKYGDDPEEIEDAYLESNLSKIPKWKTWKWEKRGNEEIKRAIDFVRSVGRLPARAEPASEPETNPADVLEGVDPDIATEYVPPLDFLKAVSAETARFVLTREMRALGITVADSNGSIQSGDVADIPPFDPSVMEGNIYGKFVDLVTKGTTLQPQYAYQAARLAVSMLIIGRVTFENLADTPPLRRIVFLGETGSGKGAVWKRAHRILTMGGRDENKNFKYSDSIDSGVGLKDMFFDDPVGLPVMLYFDEVDSLGHKSSDKKNPDILDTMGELANKTTVSRTLSTHGRTGPKIKASKTRNDAYCFWLICAPSGMTFMCATAGRKSAGFNDRNIPVFGVPVVPGNLPEIPMDGILGWWEEAYKLQAMVGTKANPGTVTMEPEARAIVESFWDSQPEAVRKKVRFKEYLQLDCYLNAIGHGRMTVTVPDVEDAIKDCRRELATRASCFQEEASDRVGFYYSACKRLTAQMAENIRKAGRDADPFEYGMSEADFERGTRAFANNEPIPFGMAWKAWLRHLEPLEARALKNGRKVIRYIPARSEHEDWF